MAAGPPWSEHAPQKGVGCDWPVPPAASAWCSRSSGHGLITSVGWSRRLEPSSSHPGGDARCTGRAGRPSGGSWSPPASLAGPRRTTARRSGCLADLSPPPAGGSAEAATHVWGDSRDFEDHAGRVLAAAVHPVAAARRFPRTARRVAEAAGTTAHFAGGFCLARGRSAHAGGLPGIIATPSAETAAP